MTGGVLAPAVVWEVPKSSQMNPYRECGCRASLEEELWQELDGALVSALTNPTWAALQAGWILQDARALGIRGLIEAVEGLLSALHT